MINSGLRNVAPTFIREKDQQDAHFFSLIYFN